MGKNIPSPDEHYLSRAFFAVAEIDCYTDSDLDDECGDGEGVNMGVDSVVGSNVSMSLSGLIWIPSRLHWVWMYKISPRLIL